MRAKDCFNWDADTLLNNVEYYLKEKGRKVCSFTVRFSDEWNIYDIKTWLDDAGYVYVHNQEKERFYVAKTKEDTGEFFSKRKVESK